MRLLASRDSDCYLVSTTSRTIEFALPELVEEARSISDAGVLGMHLRVADQLVSDAATMTQPPVRPRYGASSATSQPG